MPRGMPLLMTGRPGFCARAGRATSARSRTTTARPMCLMRPPRERMLECGRMRGRQKLLGRFAGSQSRSRDTRTPGRGARGRASHGETDSAQVGDADADAVDVADAAARADGPLLAEANVHAEAEREIYVTIATTERRHDHRIDVRHEGGVGPFHLESPAERDADRDVIRVGPVADVHARADGERAVE